MNIINIYIIKSQEKSWKYMWAKIKNKIYNFYNELTGSFFNLA